MNTILVPVPREEYEAGKEWMLRESVWMPEPVLSALRALGQHAKLVPHDGPEATWAAVGMAMREAMRR